RPLAPWGRPVRRRRRPVPRPSERSRFTLRTPTRRTTNHPTSPSASCRRHINLSGAARLATRRSPPARSRISTPGCMRDHLNAFLQFLRLNRNASVHTVRAYESDLSQFIAHAASALGVKRGELTPAQLDRQAIRSFLGELHSRGHSRATAARKLAAARTFLRYLRREGFIEDDPGALVTTPKRDVRMPAHLSEHEMDALIGAPSTDDAL